MLMLNFQDTYKLNLLMIQLNFIVIVNVIII